MLNLVDYSVSGFPLLFVGFLECLAVNWIYGQLHCHTRASSIFRINPNKRPLCLSRK